MISFLRSLLNIHKFESSKKKTLETVEYFSESKVMIRTSNFEGSELINLNNLFDKVSNKYDCFKQFI